jgi:hypothetical protein
LSQLLAKRNTELVRVLTSAAGRDVSEAEAEYYLERIKQARPKANAQYLVQTGKRKQEVLQGLIDKHVPDEKTRIQSLIDSGAGYTWRELESLMRREPETFYNLLRDTETAGL